MVEKGDTVRRGCSIFKRSCLIIIVKFCLVLAFFFFFRPFEWPREREDDDDVECEGE